MLETLANVSIALLISVLALAILFVWVVLASMIVAIFRKLKPMPKPPSEEEMVNTIFFGPPNAVRGLQGYPPLTEEENVKWLKDLNLDNVTRIHPSREEMFRPFDQDKK